MKANRLVNDLKEFQEKLVQHHSLWEKSLNRIYQNDPKENNQELQEQARWLLRKLGALKPYIYRFDDQWMMAHPATRITWNTLDEAVSFDSIAQKKGPSIKAVISKLDQIIGRLETFAEEDDIPEKINEPIKPGRDIDYIMIGYLVHLHPYISKGCYKLFVDGHYAQSIEESAKAVLQYIREKTGLTTDGDKLISAAFSTSSPILAFNDLSTETFRNEQVGFMEMLKGFVKGVRNPLAHTHAKQEEQQKTFEYLVMASLFCRRIDDASPEETKSIS
ncbi:TIGR02391 family protein [Nostoc punctiforme UO1]|uniref:TIGR02391 family protein n=1 Tax=Nostoc punctiforme TaxID=272131 RepID=UPI003095CB6C